MRKFRKSTLICTLWCVRVLLSLIGTMMNWVLVGLENRVCMLICTYYLCLFWFAEMGFGGFRNLGLLGRSCRWRRRQWRVWKQWRLHRLMSRVLHHLFKHCWVEYQLVWSHLFFTSSPSRLRAVLIGRHFRIVTRFVCRISLCLKIASTAFVSSAFLLFLGNWNCTPIENMFLLFM